MRPTPFVLSAALVLGACQKGGSSFAADDGRLLSQVKAALAERERKVVSYRYDGVTVQGDQQADFSFSWRAPTKMRADLPSRGFTFAFDGRRFAQYDANTRVLTELDLSSAPKDKASVFLHQVFAPFSPDGWRTPMLAGRLAAESIRDGKAERVSVAASAGEGDGKVVVRFVFAPPAMDFVSKSVDGGGSGRVTRSFCHPALKLCFPEVVEETVPGGETATTTLSNVEVNVALPPEHFGLTAPEGATVEQRTLP